MKIVLPKIEGTAIVGKRKAKDTPVPTPEEWGDPFQEGRVTGKNACDPLPPENKPEDKS